MKSVYLTLAFSILLSVPNLVLAADCSNETDKKTKINLEVGRQTFPNLPDGKLSSLSFMMPVQGCDRRVGARWQNVERFGISESIFGVQFYQKFPNHSFVNFDSDFAPDGQISARTTAFLEFGHPIKFKESAIDAIVASAQIRYSDYQTLDLVKLSANFEIYPRGKNFWLTTRLSQSLVDGNTLPFGYFGRMDLPFTDYSRGFMFLSQDYESEFSQVEEVHTQGIGVELGLNANSNWSLTYSEENREFTGARNSIDVGISYSF